MKYPTTIQNLIECFKKLPGVGEKTAERYALAALELDDNIIELFSKSLTDVKTKIGRCKICNNLAEEEICEICKIKDRDRKTLCIVDSPKNVVIFEKLGIYNGLYHVLDGLISPLDGKNPEDIKLNLLFERINNENISEIILALKPGIEGETTSLYIKKMLENKQLKISKIAHGIPIGIDMEYIDSLTLELALEDRTNIS
ncbi:MAG: recombination mediator RecR [Bacilli bacterium]|nr:recombination mediator RecR [Bacilli bacterium]